MCIATLKSMTYAIKAQKALSKYYINSEIVKLDPSQSKKGCAYGIKFDSINLYAAENALREFGVKYTQILTNQ